MMFLKDSDTSNNQCTTSNYLRNIYDYENNNISLPSPNTSINTENTAGTISNNQSATIALQEFIKMAKQSFKSEETPKTQATMFFEALSKQINDANITNEQLAQLQIRILQVVNSILYPK